MLKIYLPPNSSGYLTNLQFLYWLHSLFFPQHKGMPYCHHPCYRALFGPSILGYGSNISSPANFGPRKDNLTSASALNSNNNRASTGNILGSVLSEETLSSTYSLGRRNKPKHYLVHQNSNGLRNSTTSVSGGKDKRDSGESIGGSDKGKPTKTISSVASNRQRSVNFDTAPSPTRSASPLSSYSLSISPSRQTVPSQSSSDSLSSSTPSSKAERTAETPVQPKKDMKLNTSL